MSSFKFPPPPPPPPKATANDPQEQYSSTRGGRGGRGRGFQNRGRGNNSRSSGRGGHGYNGNRGPQSSQSQRNYEGGNHYGGGGAYQQQYAQRNNYENQAQNSVPERTTSPSVSPPRSYVSPMFANQMQYGAQMQPQPNPVAFAQAMAFMTTPAGRQTMAAFASHMASATQAPQPQHPLQQSAEHPPNSDRKRKRHHNVQDTNSLGASSPTQHIQPKSKPPKAKVAAPPAVPSFGFSLPTAPVSQLTYVTKKNGKRNQTSKNVNLGLNHHAEEDPGSGGSDEEDIDEEAAFASRGDLQGLKFEWNGQEMSLQTPAELAAWIKDRKKQYPTRKRIEEKARVAAERRQSELEFLRKINGKAKHTETPSVNPSASGEQKASQAKKRAELEQLRKRAHDSIAVKKNVLSVPKVAEPVSAVAKMPAVDLGLGYGSDSDSTEAEDESPFPSDSSIVSSTEDSSDESDSVSVDSDAEPEIHSAKTVPAPINIPPPVPGSSETKKSPREKSHVCPDFARYGRCRGGRKCRSHPHKEESKEEKRVGLFERVCISLRALLKHLLTTAVGRAGEGEGRSAGFRCDQVSWTKWISRLSNGSRFVVNQKHIEQESVL
jgi:hypothetical protein